ncbi:hypothetical protein BT63DRAFT_458816 [Microthyrium microscopicum]|uniref:SMP-30/Gluconolactonase/LRE-like region domain-containing protein n=1 Tax=Microthyrium microscopicum TaxID=703497 RepID=A0A6A6U5P7_9PEZI|nr:hypothetical protein BT63DRAFT_458816 [Microthyrium microscopicum]
MRPSLHLISLAVAVAASPAFATITADVSQTGGQIYPEPTLDANLGKPAGPAYAEEPIPVDLSGETPLDPNLGKPAGPAYADEPIVVARDIRDREPKAQPHRPTGLNGQPVNPGGPRKFEGDHSDGYRPSYRDNVVDAAERLVKRDVAAVDPPRSVYTNPVRPTDRPRHTEVTVHHGEPTGRPHQGEAPREHRGGPKDRGHQHIKKDVVATTTKAPLMRCPTNSPAALANGARPKMPVPCQRSPPQLVARDAEQINEAVIQYIPAAVTPTNTIPRPVNCPVATLDVVRKNPKVPAACQKSGPSRPNGFGLGRVVSEQASLADGPKLLQKFPEGTWLEDIAVGTNGLLYVTLMDRPELYRVDPTKPDAAPVLLHRFAAEGKLSGIVETAPNEFAVALARKDNSGKEIAEIWAVRCGESCEGEVVKSAKTGKLNFELIGGPYSNTNPLNGLASLAPSTLLAADMIAGTVFALPVPGQSAPSVVLADKTMASGIDGLRISGGWLYYTNTLTGILGRVPVSATSSGAKIASGPAEVVGKGMLGPDGFAVRGDVAYVADIGANCVFKVSFKDGTTTKLVDIPGAPTSAQFGRGSDKNVLYVTTMAGALYAVNVA